jgi:hypothetical protein
LGERLRARWRGTEDIKDCFTRARPRAPAESMPLGFALLADQPPNLALGAPDICKKR